MCPFLPLVVSTRSPREDTAGDVIHGKTTRLRCRRALQVLRASERWTARCDVQQQSTATDTTEPDRTDRLQAAYLHATPRRSALRVVRIEMISPSGPSGSPD